MHNRLPDALGYIAETLVIWDCLISIDDEVTLFWSSKPTWIKILFFVNRYLGIVLRIWDMFIFRYEIVHDICGIGVTEFRPLNVCYLLIDPESIIYVGLQLVVMNIIMAVRAWVIMRKQHHVLLILFGLLTIGASIVIGVLPMHNRTNYFYFIPNMLFEVAILAVVAYHEIRYWRNSKTLESSYAGVSPPVIRPIMQLMFEDSILYFVIIIAVLIIVPFLTNTVPLCLSVASITVTRTLLRLRKQALFDSDGPSSDQEELSTFRVQAVSRGMNSSSEVGEDRSS
ncbi:hypothetical protein EDD18DRAFT_1144698 [Armillaria luteobubalina]|uniref:DUF6533 domain-containing protein n=1 Tax=Armillaria luteobubalina TaxID=153913 RepID=A0AA39QFB7_9AGAR|nr:hypothetical protein EDD18DRAFT_1144698 [Armillaria luteobubalina]